jgi:hypothetical protein
MGGVIEPDRLIDEHHGDIIADLVEQSASLTDKPIAVLSQSNVSFALGACQNGE